MQGLWVFPRPKSRVLADTVAKGGASHLAGISVGMPRDKVIAILGKPETAEAGDGKEILTYNLSVDRASAVIFSGAFRALNIGKRHYRIELIDGKMTSWYEAKSPD